MCELTKAKDCETRLLNDDPTTETFELIKTGLEDSVEKTAYGDKYMYVDKTATFVMGEPGGTTAAGGSYRKDNVIITLLCKVYKNSRANNDQLETCRRILMSFNFEN